MMWRSGVAVLLTTSVVAFLVGSIQHGMRADSSLVLHNWGRPQSVETARLELLGAWAEDPPVTVRSERFSVLLFNSDRLSWYTLSAQDEKIEGVDNWEYTIKYEPHLVPHRLTITPVDDREGTAILCVYALEGDTLKLWRGTHLFPQPTGRTRPHYVLRKTRMPM